MGRYFHNDMRNSVLQHFRHNSLKIQGFRRRHGIRKRLAGIAVIDGADYACLAARGGQDAFDQIGNGCLAVGAGNPASRSTMIV